MTAVPPRPASPDEQQDDRRVERGRPRTALWWLSLAAGAGALALAWTPGVEVDLQLFRLSAHDPQPLAVVALLAAVAALVYRRQAAVLVDLPHLVEDVRRHAPAWAAGVSIVVLAYGVLWNTRTIGGSDSHCYAAQARAFASGELHLFQPMAVSAPWPDAATTFAPVGFLASTTTPGQFLPICAPGYALLVAPLVLVWPPLQFLVAPLAAAVVVFAAYVLARRISDEPLAGVGAAVLCASAPVVLFQATQPMTDVPTAAAVAGAGALAFATTPRYRAAGAALGVGLLMRPNLLPVAAPFAVFCVLRGGMPALTQLSSTLVPIASLVLVLNALIYGSPWQSGYGDTAALFALAHVPVNLRHYTAWLLETMTPIVVLGLAAPWLADRGVGGARRPIAAAMLIVSVTVVACYLAYRPFEEWWYLRFLLPAVPMICALTSASLFALLLRVPRAPAAIGMLTIVAVAAICVREARDRHVFQLWRTEQRLSATAADLARHAPNVAAIAVQPNGAISYELGQPVVSWDSLTPDSLDTAITWLRRHGHRPLIVLDQVEEAPFRQRFEKASAAGALDWPPLAVIYRTVRIYDPVDRERYVAGEPGATRFVDPPRERR